MNELSRDGVQELTGGCLCGAMRYLITARPLSVAYCHCRMCQRASGSPVVNWATLPLTAFRVTGGQLTFNRSSAKAERGFCARCGSQMTFQFTEGPNEIDVTVATLDDPATLPPQYHIWTSSQQPWLLLGDTLPRHADDGKDFSPYKNS